jgi:hypothetical protein
VFSSSLEVMFSLPGLLAHGVTGPSNLTSENRVVLRVPPCYGSGASGGHNGSTLVLDPWTKASVFISNLSVVSQQKSSGDD